MSNDKFFFEEDPESEKDSGISWEEHTDTFLSVLKKEGYLQDLPFDKLSLGSEMKAEADRNETKHVTSSLLDIEFGVIQSNYVLHITPVHAQKNLSKPALLNEAVKTAVILMNQVIPANLDVKIFMPRVDYPVKAVTFSIAGGGEAWNFDQTQLETEVVPKMLEQIGKICMLA